MNILHVASEVSPFAKTGGLGDVLGALPSALARRGHSVAVCLPLYRCVRRKLSGLHPLFPLRIAMGESVTEGRLLEGPRLGAGVRMLFVENARYYDRDGLYGTERGDYEDNAQRYIFFCRAVCEAVRRLRPLCDIVHAHDWQAGLVPVYLRSLAQAQDLVSDIRTVFSIHNLAYQGLFWHYDMKLTGLDWSHFDWRRLEFFGKLNFLKGGIVYADSVTTVSPTYAAEIQGKEHGCGLDAVLRHRSAELRGLLNGIDDELWNPETDEQLPARYSLRNLGGKPLCKRALRRACGLESGSSPLLGSTGRLVRQKGVDLLLEAFNRIIELGYQIVVLGKGERKYEEGLEEAAERHPGRAAVRVEFNEKLAHQIAAGADLFVMPSRFEPCGLNQLYSLRYGTVPVVRATGGLADTVVDATPEALRSRTATGFVFREATAEALLEALERARELYANRAAWRQLSKTGMAQDFSWNRSALEYETLYRELLER